MSCLTSKRLSSNLLCTTSIKQDKMRKTILAAISMYFHRAKKRASFVPHLEFSNKENVDFFFQSRYLICRLLHGLEHLIYFDIDYCIKYFFFTFIVIVKRTPLLTNSFSHIVHCYLSQATHGEQPFSRLQYLLWITSPFIMVFVDMKYR